jgi:dihydroflavonol-4-reductase
MKLKDQTDFLKELLPEYRKKLPKGIAPSWLIKILAIFQPALKSAASEVGKNRELDSSRARNLLGWQPRPAKEALQAAAESVVKFGLVKPD